MHCENYQMQQTSQFDSSTVKGEMRISPIINVETLEATLNLVWDESTLHRTKPKEDLRKFAYHYQITMYSTCIHVCGFLEQHEDLATKAAKR